MAAVLRGRLLGRFEVSVDGRPIERSAFERPSGARLLKLLLATPGHRVRRESAAELLWPEADPERSGANLRKAIFFARRALEGDVPERESIIRSDADALRISDAVALELDVDRLRVALEGPRSPAPAGRDRGGGGGADDGADPIAALEVIADLAGEELLPEDPYEEWLIPIRERLGQQTLDALQRGATAAREAGNHELAFRLVDRTLALDPADEAAHRLAIELYLEAGQLHAARRQLVACARALAETFGVEPSPDLAELIEAAAARRASATVLAGEAPIIGRRRELEAAEGALDAVTAGRLGIVIYRGAAGIGKTRVLRELARGAAASGWRTIEARGLESSPGVAFGDLGTAIPASLGNVLPDALEEPGRSALQAISPAFGGRQAVSFASDAALVTALIDGLVAIARERPLVLALDDIQWLDRATLDLVDTALGGLASLPVLLVGTVRDAPDPLPRPVAALLEDVERAGGRIVQLGPIGRREVEQLLERELGGRLEPPLVEAVAERSGGAPLFALEVLRGARAAGTLLERGGVWRLATPDTTLPVPPGVGLMVARRAEGLPGPVTRILTVAAELGDEIGLEPLVAATSPDRPALAPGDLGSARSDGHVHAGAVLDALDAGMEAGLLVERAGGYGFAHPLFRSALRASVRPRQRADLHLRVARALAAGIDETSRRSIDAAVTLGRDVVGIASHALDAVDLGRLDAMPLAIGFGFAAGERQAALFNHAAASTTVQRALSLWVRLPREDAQAFPGFRAYMQLGSSQQALGDEVAARRAFQAAALATAVDRELAQARQAEAWIPYQHSQFDEADAILAAADDDISDPVAKAGIASDRAWILGRRGQWSVAYGQLVEAVRVIEGANEPVLLARSLDRLGVAMRDAVDGVGSVSVLERGYRLATDIGDSRLAATIRMHLAGAYRQIGRLDDATREIEATLATCSMTGDRYIEAVTLWIAAEVRHAAGRYDEAIEMRRREIGLLRSFGGNEQNQAMAHAHISFLERRLGNVQAAERESTIARQIAGHAGLSHLPGWVDEALSAPEWFMEDAPAGPGRRRDKAWDSGGGLTTRRAGRIAPASDGGNGNAAGTGAADPSGHDT